MKTIYKYPVKVGINKILVPKNVQILKFGYTHEGLFIWALVNTLLDEFKNIEIEVVGTGWTLEEYSGLYIDSVITNDGYVWHAFQTSF